MDAQTIRKKYLEFMVSKGHKVIPRASIVPQNDPTTLFTGSGMQPLIPYLLGETHPYGTRLTDSQPSLRAQDIEDIGDNRHTTFFEMLGNWSLGDYTKADEISWIYEFLIRVVGIDPNRLYVSCFIGAPEFDIPRDTEAAELWQKEFVRDGIEAKIAEIGSEENGYQRGINPGERIFYYDGSKNWWNRGKTSPQTTPVGDPCGPDSEMFYDFGTPHDPKFGKKCHPNCDCGRFMEIGNNVFMTYRKVSESKFEPLPKPNIDQGSGLERIAAAAIHTPDVFEISLMKPIVQKLEELSGKNYASHMESMRVIADHLRGATFLAVDGVVPSNKTQGYVMRRLLRRAIRYAFDLGIEQNFLQEVVPVIADMFVDDYPEVKAARENVIDVLTREEKLFRQTLRKGLHEFGKLVIPAQAGIQSKKDSTATGSPIEPGMTSGRQMTHGEAIFTLYDTYGFPVELSAEEAFKRGVDLDPAWREQFEAKMAEQRERSQTAAKGIFKGGLADHSDIVTKYHTATHLMYQALKNVLGNHVIQRGSNITAERLRFDFSHPEKMTPGQIAEVEKIVNEQIEKDWPVGWREENTKQALANGVSGAFGDKYGETVKVYTVGDPDGEYFSREICGGPHVTHTGALAEGGKHFKIQKEESSSAGVRRIKAVLG
jgi:alanyl-tRNA synthetase